MKTRNKIFLGIGGFFALLIAGVMIVTAWDSPCPTASPADPGGDTMRAARHVCYGVPRGLQMQRVAKPVPGDGQVLVKIRAASINPAEWYGVSGQPYVVRLGSGIGAPKDPLKGFDMAGVVEAVGPNVTLFKPGDEVFGGAHGSFAEYALARETRGIVHKPANLSFEEAAAIPIAAVTALQGLRDHGHIAAGQKVLINGASGGVGTYAIQIAKSFGAEVTAVCSTRNVELVRSLGADHVIDYTTADFTTGDVRYDLILDNVGNHGYTALGDVTKPGGYIVSVGGSKANPWLGPITRVFLWRPMVKPLVDAQLPFYIASVKKEDMQFLADLAAQGKLRSVIDRTYPLERIGEALEYLGTQRARGKVVVTIQ
jgi:NADPH:quinone reductase-like Zn-dependent oxidoreductase